MKVYLTIRLLRGFPAQNSTATVVFWEEGEDQTKQDNKKKE